VSRRRGQAPSGAAGFFDHFRGALARLPAGLIRVGPPARPEDLLRAEAALGRPLPAAYADFLRSFDGADLFQETVVIAGVGPEAALRLDDLAENAAPPLLFATGAADERYGLLDDGRVVRQDAGSDERALAGSSFGAWLDATVAAHQILFGPDGEYAPDVFDPSGEEITPVIALRQAERALKQDPGAAGWAHAQGVALTRLGRTRAAVDALERAAQLDPDNPWLWFDLGRAALEAGQGGRAAEVFQRAAALEAGPGGAMLLAWAARAQSQAGGGPPQRQLADEALRRDPGLPASLARAIESAAADGDDAAQAEATALLAAVDPAAIPPPRVRLKVIDAEATEPRLPTPPPARPPRPSRGGRRRSGARRPGS
jgi:hypothetical protein